MVVAGYELTSIEVPTSQALVRRALGLVVVAAVLALVVRVFPGRPEARLEQVRGAAHEKAACTLRADRRRHGGHGRAARVAAQRPAAHPPGDPRPTRTTSARCNMFIVKSHPRAGTPSACRHVFPAPNPVSGTRVIGGPDDRMSQRQQAVLDAIRARHPRPTTAAQLPPHSGSPRAHSTSPCARSTVAD